MPEYRFSRSWRQLTPQRVKYGNLEPFEDYYQRIGQSFPNIPQEVFRQWLHGLHNEYETQKNYAWLDYTQVKFTLEEINTQILSSIHILTAYRKYVDLRSSYTDIKQFHCTKKDLAYWQEFGTWRTPPVILDVDSLHFVPPSKELKKPLQLVEGHSRLGYLYSLCRIESLGKATCAPTHKVWMMRLEKD